MKKIKGALVLTAFSVIVSGSLHATSGFAMETEEFQDISGHWAEEEIDWLFQEGWIEGVGNATYAPNNEVKRGDAALLLTRIDGGVNEEATTCELEDIEAEQYYSAAVCHAFSEGWIDGYPDGTYRPEEPLSREEMAAILHERFENELTEERFGTYLRDISEDNWSYDAIHALVASRVAEGYEAGTFQPDNEVSRAEWAAFVSRIFEEAFRIPQEGNSPANLANEGLVAFENNEVFVNPNGESLQKISLDGTMQQELLEGKNVEYINSVRDELYFINDGENVHRINKNGEQLETLYEGAVDQLYVDSEQLLIQTGEEVQRAKSDAPEQWEPIGSVSEGEEALLTTYDGEQLISTHIEEGIFVNELASGEKTHLSSLQAGMAFEDAGYVYVGNYNGELVRINPRSGEEESILTAGEGPMLPFNVYGEHLYFGQAATSLVSPGSPLYRLDREPGGEPEPEQITEESVSFAEHGIYVVYDPSLYTVIFDGVGEDYSFPVKRVTESGHFAPLLEEE